MLPSILKIAEDYNLVFNPRTYAKKETMCKCPFCREDTNKDKYYLSLNTTDNVFKCWFCKKSGGVLGFESLLSNKSFQEVKEKYFGKGKKDLHPAYRLNPEQLKRIGWQDQKRKDFNSFKKSREKVRLDWEAYEFEELATFYALFLLIKDYPIEAEQKKHYAWFLEMCMESKVTGLSDKIIHSYKSNEKFRWVNEGKRISLMAFEHCYKTGDFEFVNLFVNVLLIIESLKIVKISGQQTAI